MSEIPAGVYKGRAVVGSEQFGTTKNGTDQIVLDVNIPELGRQVSVILYFSTKAKSYSLEKLRACGWSGDDVTQLSGIGDNDIIVSIQYETYEGKERIRTDIVTGGGRIKLDAPMDAAAKRGFAARMKSATKAVPVPAPAKQDAVSDANEDDLPF